MSIAPLSLVPPVAETPGARANRLMAEARMAAAEQVEALEAALLSVVRLSAEIANGGDAYSPGVREVCRRVVDEAVWSTQTLDALVRHGAPIRRR